MRVGLANLIDRRLPVLVEEATLLRLHDPPATLSHDDHRFSFGSGCRRNPTLAWDSVHVEVRDGALCLAFVSLSNGLGCPP
jgi:hypothetical protein